MMVFHGFTDHIILLLYHICNMYVYVATMVIQGVVQSARIWYKTERPRNSLKIALFSSSLLGTANMLVENFYMV